MSKARGQSLNRAFSRGNIDAYGNRIKVSSTKVTKSGINLPGVKRKNYYPSLTDEERNERREKRLKREAKARI